MSDEDPAYARRLRTDAGFERRIDGGAIAAGLCLSLLAVFLTIAGPMPGSVSLGITATCILAGGALAGYLSRSDARGGIQGIGVVVFTAGLMLAVAVSTTYGAGSPLRVPLVFAYDALSTPAFVLLLALAGIAGALAGELGTHLRA